MTDAPPSHPHLRYARTNLRALGIPQDSRMTVHQAHLHGCASLDEAVDIYRGVFGLSGDAGIRITSADNRTVIAMDGPGATIMRVPGNPLLLGAEMVVHR